VNPLLIKAFCRLTIKEQALSLDLAGGMGWDISEKNFKRKKSPHREHGNAETYFRHIIKPAQDMGQVDSETMKYWRKSRCRHHDAAFDPRLARFKRAWNKSVQLRPQGGWLYRWPSECLDHLGLWA
jgi:hypothetical protein